MKNTKFLKSLIILGLSLLLILVQFNIVFASDDLYEPFAEIPVENNAATNNAVGNEIGNGISNTTPISNNTSVNNTARNNTIGNSVTNRDVSNTNQLAETGLAQTGGIIALIIVVLAISAIYSYKKVDDYKKL